MTTTSVAMNTMTKAAERTQQNASARGGALIDAERSSSSDGPTHQSELEHVILDLDCGERICSCLDPMDAMNLFTTNRALKKWSKSNQCREELLDWWEQQHLWNTLNCDVDLLCKICKAYRHGGWKVVGTGEDDSQYETVFDVLDVNFPPGSFSNPEQDMLDSFNFPEEVMKQVNQTDVTKRCRYECKRCACTDRDILYFFINEKPYCGNCVEDDYYLKAAFGYEHSFGVDSTTWMVDERNIMEDLNAVELEDDEFSVYFFGWCTMAGVAGYYFIGKGRRNPYVDYSGRGSNALRTT